MVLGFTAVAAISILALGGVILAVVLSNPTADVSAAVQGLTAIISGIVGALLGLLAGRSDSMAALANRPPPRTTE
jgi:hypothetical protein